jgi:Protein of unknown function (DUF2946)
MRFSAFRHKRHLTSWLISCVIGLVALMPTLSAWAMATWMPPSLAQVCTVQGARWVQASDVAHQRDAGSTHGQGHCPFCVLQDHSPFLPPQQASSPLALPVAGNLLPLLFLRAPRALHAWSPLAARAPPAFV